MFTRNDVWIGDQAPPGWGGLGRFAAMLAVALERRRQRARLATLDARMLRDIGITPGEAAREAAKPCWQR